jgi:hypothetical protein
MLVGENDISRTQVHPKKTPFTKRTDNNSEKTTLNVPRVVFSYRGGAKNRP